MFINNKNAVSPLIATVLLIAFAVALGAVVMNIPQNPGGHPSSLTNTGCDSVSLKILKTSSGEFLCYNVEQKQLLLTLINEPTGSDLNGFTVKVYGRPGYTAERSIDETLVPGQEDEIVIAYDDEVGGAIQRLVIIPKAGESECHTKKIERNSILNCQ